MARIRRPSLNLTELLEQAVADLCLRVPDFAHIDPRRLLLLLTRARGSSKGGTFAKIVPMRYPCGGAVTTVAGHQYALPQIPTPHGDVLYLIYIYVPRFFDQPFERRLLTLVHELYHIAPAFDGTIRQVGRGAHGASRATFNARLQPLIDGYLASAPRPETLAALRLDLHAAAREQALVGRTLPLPKPIRLT